MCRNGLLKDESTAKKIKYCNRETIFHTLRDDLIQFRRAVRCEVMCCAGTQLHQLYIDDVCMAGTNFSFHRERDMYRVRRGHLLRMKYQPPHCATLSLFRYYNFHKIAIDAPKIQNDFHVFAFGKHLCNENNQINKFHLQ